MSHAHHSINYIEFSVTNVTQAKEFYHSAFGWIFNDYGPDYAGIKAAEGDGEIGGFSKATQVTTGGPLVVLYSSKLTSSLESVKSSGGTITKEVFEFPGGQRFEFQDPFGNILAVWSEK